jgi:hypothetical protein
MFLPRGTNYGCLPYTQNEPTDNDVDSAVGARFVPGHRQQHWIILVFVPFELTLRRELYSFQ